MYYKEAVIQHLFIITQFISWQIERQTERVKMIFFSRTKWSRAFAFAALYNFLTLILTWLILWTCNAYSYVDWWMFRTDRIKLSSSIRDYMLAHIVLTLVLLCSCYIYLQLLLPLFPPPYDCFCKTKLNKFFVELLTLK